MDLGIEGRVAMVLGAGGGLGGAIASKLLEEGARVAPCDLYPQSIAAELAKAGPVIELDLRRPDQVTQAVDQVEAELGPVEILVNVTGGPPPGPIAEIASADWSQQFESMVVSIIALTNRVLPGMRKVGWGRILTSTSSGVVAPIPMLGISNSLRGALHGWAKTLSNEVAGDGITVNTILPGRVATTRIAHLDESRAQRTGKSVDQVEAESVASIPVGRYGRPDEYASAAAFLCSGPASYINGAVIRVDGGLIASV